MITIRKQLTLPDTYPLERIGALKDLLFFDIETTGFSGDYNSLYLIGCSFWQDGSWQLLQWFADSKESEPELLSAFFEFLKDFRILVHFNGDGFDLPFLLKRCRHFHLDYDFSGVTSFDIYKKIRPYRKLLGLESLKQKSIEQFLGVSRKDQYSGGQLIEVYQDYLMTRETFLYDLLILHNEDDLKGMPLILPILYYPDLFESPLVLSSHEISEETDLFGDRRHLLHLYTASRTCSVPVPFEAEVSPVSCQVTGSHIHWTVELYDGTLKHFYPNYKDYYYLIYEDTAIHKSVGEYVDKDARVKATAKTCYTRREGCFLPQFEPLWEPVLKQEPKDRLCYTAIGDIPFEDLPRLEAYFRQLMNHLGAGSLQGLTLQADT